MRTDFQLGEWLVRPQRDCIERGGRVVHVKPKSMAVLVRLAQDAGEVVTRDEFFNAIWPGSAVTDDVLTQCIVELRRSLGDSARDPRYIETIPKVGFRLLPGVAPTNSGAEAVAGAGHDRPESPASGPRQAASRMTFFIASSVLMGLVFFWYLTGSREVPPPMLNSDAKSLAVLPFVDISEDQDQGWYAYGLTEELINRLAQLRGLQVTSRTASYRYLGRNEDLRKVGGELGVSHLLEGSVRKDEDRLRITAQLIEAENGYHAWSKQFDRPSADIFEVQEEIAESVATALSIQLQVGDLGSKQGGTDSVEAYELLMLSKRYQWEATPESMLQAIDSVKRAIEIDPDYARAWYRLSGLYVNTSSIRHNMEDIDWMALSEQALDRARTLAPDMDDIKHLTMTIQYSNQRWSEVEETMDRGAGLELSSDFDLLFGWMAFLNQVGRIQESVSHLERIHRLNPWSPGSARARARNYMILGRTEESLAEAERAFELEGFKWEAVANGMKLAMYAPRRETLQTWLGRAEQYMPDQRELVLAMKETLDDREAALAWLRNAFNETEDHDLLIPPWAAFHGDYDLALGAMQRRPVPAAFWGKEMSQVRRSPAFKDLLRQVGLEDYFREYGWNDFCRPLGAEDFVCD